MNNDPHRLRYSREHEWVALEGEKEVYLGITDFAQSSLGDIVFVELPEKDQKVEQGGILGAVESIKSVSDLYSPVTGEVVNVNSSVVENPSLCNEDPYSSWMVKLKIKNPSEISQLMNFEEYKKFCEE